MEAIEKNIRDIMREIDAEKEAKEKYKKRLEDIRSDISLFETTLEIKEEEIRRIEERKESLVDSVNFFLEAQEAKPNNDLRIELEEANHKLEAENAMGKNQEKVLSKRIQALQESLEEAEKSLDEDFLKKRIQKLQQDIKLSESSKSHTMSTLSDLQSELKLLEISQRSLQEDLNSSNEAISNLFTIKEDLLQKTLHFENVENALTVKLNSHQQDEKNLVKDLCYFKRLAEEAVLSFQKFSVKYIGIISQNAGIIISEFNAKPYIALQIGKQEYYLAHEPSCTVYMHPKKKNRFFICLDGKNREFESAHSEKIAHSISAALHKSLNI